METWLIPLFGGVGAALLGLITTLAVQYLNRHKTDAEARSTDADYGVKVTASAVTLINELQDEVHALRERQKAIDVEREAERKELVELRSEVKRMAVKIAALQDENTWLREELSQLRKAFRS